MSSQLQIAFCTTPDQACAERLAQILVAQKLAACVNILPEVSSIYRWQGEVEQDSEVLMLIKTQASLIGQIEQLLAKEHPYEVPELIAVDINSGSNNYLQWLASSLK